MPKPTDLTPEIQKRICDAIVAGMHLSPAAEANGVPARTANEWLQRGENRNRKRPANALYALFAAAVREAEAQCERAAIVYWRNAIPENWQAAAKFLERRFPDRWGVREKIEHSGPGGSSISLQVVEQIVTRRVAREPDDNPAITPGSS